MLKTIDKVDDKNLVLGLTINERSRVLEEYNQSSQEALKKWLNRKSLLKTSDIEEMMDQQYQGIETFQLGIQPLSVESMDALYRFLTETDWYQMYKEIFESYEDERVEQLGYDFTYPIRYFLQYVKRELLTLMDRNTVYRFSSNAVISLLQGYCDELTSILSKTLAADIQWFKKTSNIAGESAESRFKYYLSSRFNDLKSSKEFYIQYPALLRLMVERTIFFIDNMKEFIQHLNDEQNLIEETFGIHSTMVEEVQLSAGDSHNKGKAVLLISFSSGEKLVYKPKNLLYAKELNTLFNYFNKKYQCSFYPLKRILKRDYTFEEFIAQASCTSTEEVRTFYRNYGQLIGVAYLLKGTDFHYENLIACGSKPVLIDIETFFQQSPPINMGNNANVMAKLKQLDSVIVTGLVPFEILKDRSRDGKKGINISALSGGMQKAPFKVLKATNLMTDEMRFEYQDHYIAPAKNLPMLNGEEVAFDQFMDEIIEGFETFLSQCVMDKANLIAMIQDLFSGVRVRNVVRPTQRYADLLQFSYHPTCMLDMIEREKVLQNLWAYPFTHKEIAKVEYKEMLVGDIPQFFNITNDKDLVTNTNQRLTDIYDLDILSKVLEKMKHLDTKGIQQQIAYISTSMGSYHRYSYMNQKNDVNQKTFNKQEINQVVHQIARELIDEAIVDHSTKTITWLDIRMLQDWAVEPLNNQLYDGLPGIYLFFSALEYIDSENQYKEVKQYLKNTMYTIPVNEVISGFLGKGSLIYPLIVDYLLNNDDESLQVAKEIADHLIDHVDFKHHQDWIQGQTSLIAVFMNLYKVTRIECYKHHAQFLAGKLEYNKDLKYVGFGHGNSSLYYALSLIEKKNIAKIKHMIQLEDTIYSKKENGWLDPRYEEAQVKHSWCHGSLGILLSRLGTEKNIKRSLPYLEKIDKLTNLFDEKNDDCLCHGNAGDIELLIQLQEKKVTTPIQSILDKKVNRMLSMYQANGHFQLQGNRGFKAKGLFTGVSGVGYQLIRYMCRDVPNVLLLELPNKFKEVDTYEKDSFYRTSRT